MPKTRMTQRGPRAPKDTHSGGACWVGVREGHPAPKAPNASRKGRAGAFALLILGAGLGLLFVLSRGPKEADPTEAGPQRESSAAAAEPAGDTGPLEAAAPAREATGFTAEGPGVDVRDVGTYSKVERAFDGRGTVAGSVTTEDGSLPPPWVLHFEPSKLTSQGSHAVGRVVQGEDGAADFYERDLPMGAYRIWAEAEGYRSNTSEVVLFRIAGDDLGRGLDHVHVDLKLRRFPDVMGAVIDADAGVADGLPVYLVPEAGGERREGETDLNGRFRFGAVAPGRWTLHVGHPTHPLADAVALLVEHAPVELEAVQLPMLANIDLYVADEYARPFPNVRVQGYLKGKTAPALRGRTGPQGHFQARFLVPGVWRIETDVPEEPENFGGRYDYEIEAARETQRIEMVIRERG